MKIAVRLMVEIGKKDHTPEIKMAPAKVNAVRLSVFHRSLRDFLPEL